MRARARACVTTASLKKKIQKDLAFKKRTFGRKRERKEKTDDIATQHIAADTTTTRTTTTKTLNAGAVTGENTSQGKHVYIT